MLIVPYLEHKLYINLSKIDFKKVNIVYVVSIIDIHDENMYVVVTRGDGKCFENSARDV